MIFSSIWLLIDPGGKVFVMNIQWNCVHINWYISISNHCLINWYNQHDGCHPQNYKNEGRARCLCIRYYVYNAFFSIYMQYSIVVIRKSFNASFGIIIQKCRNCGHTNRTVFNSLFCIQPQYHQLYHVKLVRHLD